MTNNSANCYLPPRYCFPARERKRVITGTDEDPRDDQPTWPGTEHDDDEGVADGMCDDDDDDRPAATWLPWALGVEQVSPWDEAIARICVSRSRSDSV
jgi:hypothetical protein